MTNSIVSERNDVDISMVENILAKEESKRAKTNINIRNNSWEIIFVLWDSCKRDPIAKFRAPLAENPIETTGSVQ